MNRRHRSSTIVAYFKNCTKAKDTLKKLKLKAVLTSQLLKQWAIEVPAGQENKYIDKLENLEEVDHVNEFPLFARTAAIRRVDQRKSD
jgi:hypothetical protein